MASARECAENAVRAQLRAMGCQRYTLLLLNGDKPPIRMEGLTPGNVVRDLDWLMYENQCGGNVYVQPAEGGRRVLVLVDDLSAEGLEAMERDGFTPACVVETSPANFQAWVLVGMAPVPDGERRAAARILARLYGGDPCSAGASHMGRLAGFTNRKEKYRGMGRGGEGEFPFVKCRNSRGLACRKGPWLREEARREATLEASAPCSGRAPAWKSARASVRPACPPPPEVFEAAKRLHGEWLARQKALRRVPNASGGEWAVACGLFEAGLGEELVYGALAALVKMPGGSFTMKIPDGVAVAKAQRSAGRAYSQAKTYCCNVNQALLMAYGH